MIAEHLGYLHQGEGVVKPFVGRPITLPESFWEPMEPADKSEVARLEASGLLLLPSGSRYICPGHHGDGSDFDMYSIWWEGTFSEMKQLVDLGEPVETLAESRAPDSVSFRKGKLNLIVFFSSMHFARFKDATDICRSICVTKRDDRVKIFRAVCREN